MVSTIALALYPKSGMNSITLSDTVQHFLLSKAI